MGAAGAVSTLPPAMQKALADVGDKPGSLSQIEHVIVFMQENRSFDTYFGTLRGVRGFSDPSAELATIIHTGPHADYDRSYGALGAYVTQQALAVDGPIRENYLIGPAETRDESLWRTEVGWPIFETRPQRD
jgi:phospholipase C